MVSSKQLTKTVGYLIKKITSKQFSPILEADVVGYLYHLLIQKNICKAHLLHIDTRVAFGPNGAKVDMAVGKLIPVGSKETPAVAARMIIECKVFVEGFGSGRRGGAYSSLFSRDLPKLRKYAIANKKCRLVMLILDEKGYLNDEDTKRDRLRQLIQERNKKCRAVKIILAQNNAEDGSWRVRSI